MKLSQILRLMPENQIISNINTASVCSFFMASVDKKAT